MTDVMQEPAHLLGRLGRHWGWLLAYGIVTLAAGIATLVWPNVTLLVIAVLFGVQLIVSGIFRLVAAFAIDEAGAGTPGAAGAARHPLDRRRPVGGPPRAGDPARAHHLPGHLLGGQRHDRYLHRAFPSRDARSRLDRLHGAAQHRGRHHRAGLAGAEPVRPGREPGRLEPAIGLSRTSGGGMVTAVDEMRSVVPVRTVDARPNRKYLARKRDVTCLNMISDQAVGLAGKVISDNPRRTSCTCRPLLVRPARPRRRPPALATPRRPTRSRKANTHVPALRADPPPAAQLVDALAALGRAVTVGCGIRRRPCCT